MSEITTPPRFGIFKTGEDTYVVGEQTSKRDFEIVDFGHSESDPHMKILTALLEFYQTKELTDYTQLEVGKYYWTFDKQFLAESNVEDAINLMAPNIVRCQCASYLWTKVEDNKERRDPDLKTMYLGEHMWANPTNNAAFDRWRIFGPIPTPLFK